MTQSPPDRMYESPVARFYYLMRVKGKGEALWKI
jgi:hypothetical protein